MLERARVVAVHPESHSVDLVFETTGRRAAGVKVATSMAGGNVGVSGLPTPTLTDPSKPYETGLTGVRDIIAVVDYADGVPIVTGFLHPQNTQMLFPDKDLMVFRHPSDLYATVDGAGNFILRHPSGAYIGIGETASLPDLTGQDYNGAWKIGNNTQRQAYIHLAVANTANGTVTTLTLSPTGAITLDAAQGLEFTADSFTLNGPTTINGATTVAGNFAASSGTFTHNGVDVGSTHVHIGVQPGSGLSGVPVGGSGGGGGGGSGSGITTGDGGAAGDYLGGIA